METVSAEDLVEMSLRDPRCKEFSEEEKDSLTIEQIFEIEPALVELEKLVLSYHGDEGKPFCANAHWFGYQGRPSIKRIMVSLVGWFCHNPALKTQHAYETVYQHLYQQFPNCKKCGC